MYFPTTVSKLWLCLSLLLLIFCLLLELNSVDLGGEDTTADDFLIAQLLQKQFDKEFDENLQNVSFYLYEQKPCIKISEIAL